jgi:hypothetical protein
MIRPGRNIQVSGFTSCGNACQVSARKIMPATRNLIEHPTTSGTTPMRASLAIPSHAAVSWAERRSPVRPSTVLLLALASSLVTTPALAQTTRTYVSGKGSDANACTQAAPCLTLQAAHSVIRGFTNGIAFQPSASSALSVTRTLIANNGTGVLFQNTAASTSVLADIQLVVGNGAGLLAQGTSSIGPATITVQSSVAASNSTVGIAAGANSSVRVTGSTISNDAVGLQTQAGSGLLQVSHSSVTANGTGWAAVNGGQLYSAANNSIGGNVSGNSAPPTGPAPASTPASMVTIDVANLPLGTVAANSLAPICFTNPTDTVFAHTYWTPASTKYLRAPSAQQLVIKSLPACNTRDVELTTWTRQGYVYVRLDSTGKAIYFLHQGETTNGYLEIGIVTGLDETAYPGGTYYPLYKNDNLVGTVPGYSKTNTTGASFTFGVSGFEIYARFNGVEFMRFKEYRQMNSGAVALKANTGYGFRAITMSPLTTQYLYSDYANNKLDLRDWNVRSIQTKGTIAGGSNSLSIAAPQNFQVGDWVIVEIGAEAGAGVRGTIGVGGQWPALYYANAAAMSADSSKPVNTFAWTQDDGVVYQWNGSTWTISFGGNVYYVAKAIPSSLHGRITAISGDGLTLTLDNAATVAATNANVYLDNQPFVNYLTAKQKDAPGFYADLTPITPTGMTIVFPAGSYAGSGLIKIAANDSWTIAGQEQQSTTLFAPKGVYSLGFWAENTHSGHTFSNFTLQGNFGIDKYGLASSGWTYIPGGLLANGLMPANPDTDDNHNHLTQTNIPRGMMYPGGIYSGGSNNVTVEDVTVNDVSQKAVGVDFASNVWAYRVTNNQNSVLQNYVQWQFGWSDTRGGGCVDCTVNSVALVAGFSSFKAVNHRFIRPVSINAGFSQNNSQGWLIQDATVTVTPASTLPPAWSKNNPLVNISTNIGGNNVASGGTISNININVQGYIDSNNDVPVGIIVNRDNPNITITGGSYTAPNYASPSALVGPQGIRSTGANTQVSHFTSCGTLSATGLLRRATEQHANIGLADGSVINSKAGVIVAPTQSGNSPCW